MADYGSGGWDLDEYGSLVPRSSGPPGTRINGMPDQLSASPLPQGNPRIAGHPYFPDVATATRTPSPLMQPPGVAPSNNLPARIINTPDSSTGTPFRQAPSAVSATPAPTAPRGQLTPQSWGPNAGAPAPGVPDWVCACGWRPTRGGAYGLGGYLMGKIIQPQPTNQGEDEVLKRFQPAPNTTPGTQTAPQTQTQTAPQGVKTPIPPPPNAPIDPWGPTPPAGGNPPFRGPVPAYLPHRGPQGAQASQPGQGAGNGASTGVVQPQDVNLGHYRASVGNARTPTWVPGGMDAPAPQIFRGPTTMQGASNYGGGPRGAQNYYQPGSAPMAPGDWTGTGPVAGPLAAQNPMQSGNARGGGGIQTFPYGRLNGGQLGSGAPPSPSQQVLAQNAARAGNSVAQQPPRRPPIGGFGANPLAVVGAGP